MAWCVAKWLHVCYLGLTIGSLLFGVHFWVLNPKKPEVPTTGEEAQLLGAKESILVRFIVANVMHVTLHGLAMALVFLFLGLPRTVREEKMVHVASLRFLSLQLVFYLCIVRQVVAREVPMWLFWNGVNGSLLLQITLAKTRFDTVAAASVTVRPGPNGRLYAFIVWNAVFSVVHLADIAGLVPGPCRGLKSVVLLQCGLCVIRSGKQLLQARLHWQEARGRISWEQRSLGTVALCIAEGFVCFHCSVLQSSLLLLVQRSLSLVNLALVARACIIVQQLGRLVRRYRQERTYTMLVQSALAHVPAARIPEGRRVCPVCREDMHCAVRLDCGHHFHASCALAALERVPVCPVCRARVAYRRDAGAHAVAASGALERLLNTLHATRYVASVQMVDEVAEVLPAAPRLAVIKDLALTGSVDATIERLRGAITPDLSSTPSAPTAPAALPRAVQDQQIQQLDDSLESVLWGEPIGLFTECWRDCAAAAGTAPTSPVVGEDDTTFAAPPPRAPCPSTAFMQRKLEIIRQACQRFRLAQSSASQTQLSDPVL